MSFSINYVLFYISYYIKLSITLFPCLPLLISIVTAAVKESISSQVTEYNDVCKVQLKNSVDPHTVTFPKPCFIWSDKVRFVCWHCEWDSVEGSVVDSLAVELVGIVRRLVWWIVWWITWLLSWLAL